MATPIRGILIELKEGLQKRYGSKLKDVIINPRYALDLLVYTPSEFDEMKEKSIFVRRILSEGKRLYEA